MPNNNKNQMIIETIEEIFLIAKAYVLFIL